ncbi:hypothetical protein COE51_12770 [Bacillus pseudomycoides]|nr:hypothetical protein COE51_12770 [Bacillus pseudomycoides]
MGKKRRYIGAASVFLIVQLQRLEQSVVSRLPARQKAPLRQELQRPPVLSEPLPLFLLIQECA